MARLRAAICGRRAGRLTIPMNQTQLIREQAGKIVASGVLGRSRSYSRLFEFLVDNSVAGRQPKEFEIATEVFSKAPDFDPSQDSMVRVYAHNLRQKLKQFYDGEGSGETVRLYIPRGEYRLALEETAPEDDIAEQVPARQFGFLPVVVAAAVSLVIGILIGVNFWASEESEYVSVTSTPIWNQLLDDDIPVLVVVGDYYIFAELDEDGNVARFVREFSINSRDELDALMRRKTELAGRYQDLDVTYLARSTATALRSVFRVLYTSDKPVSVVSMSELDPADLRTNHVVYVGYLSALDKLFDFVFASSDLAIGSTFDQLWNIETGEYFTSEAGRPNDYRNYRDYGFFSTFPGPSGNQFAIVAGTRDEGVMHIAQVISDPLYVPGVVQAIPPEAVNGVPAFELLYEVTGFDRTNIDAMLVHAAALDYRQIWRGELLQFIGESR